MEIPEDLHEVCRLCWSYDIYLDWEDDMFDYGKLCFKECFYTFTQAEENALDYLSPYICVKCANNIRNFHLMVEKYDKILRRLGGSEISDSDKEEIQFLDDICLDEPMIDNLDDTNNVENDENSQAKNVDQDIVIFNLNSPSHLLSDSDAFSDNYDLQCDRESNNKHLHEEIPACNEGKEDPITQGGNARTSLTKCVTTKNAKDPRLKSSSRNVKKSGLCSYCSKYVQDVYTHELTHEENRQRQVACPTCGIKLYNKRSLYQHKKTHDKNRVKKYECEFCGKAFYNRGSCNVHRRIHLGQMIQCPMCPKQFYRQIELDNHKRQHSHEIPSSCSKTTAKKYYIHCKECDRKIVSNRFKEHRATHMNEPYMRCTLCEKDFCSRRSGGKHMSSVHKRKGGDYDDITYYYQSKDGPRLSLLLMKQQEEVEPSK